MGKAMIAIGLIMAATGYWKDSGKVLHYRWTLLMFGGFILACMGLVYGFTTLEF